MNKERQLYDLLVDKFIEILDKEPTHQQLKVIQEFLKDNDIHALPDKHEGLNSLASKVYTLPFNDEEIEKIAGA